MANFIEEVDEEVRREKAEKLWKRWSPFIIGVVVVMFGVMYYLWRDVAGGGEPPAVKPADSGHHIEL